ncbi:hypothetical protein E0500_000265 [Streptomyces sp. KM273126]|uniref:hypothetical protein n=1 Tax=Streptomyces sp. KM273126 TaxID=2545247 RepID=UPI001404E739|nr:hypothetical protein [Streptomyces sp. KM273126]MBA2805943.1 hypothetical protein [Streptomyces sp. KM273126]
MIIEVKPNPVSLSPRARRQHAPLPPVDHAKSAAHGVVRPAGASPIRNTTFNSSI